MHHELQSLDKLPTATPSAPVLESTSERATDRFFNPYRVAVGENAITVVKEACTMVTNFERGLNLRKRARKPADQKTFEAVIEALVCDMISVALTQDDRGSAIPFSKQVLAKKWRYRPACYSEILPDIAERMASPEMAYLKLEKGYPKGRQSFASRGQRTLIRPGDRIRWKIDEHQITSEDIGSQHTEEIIVLKTHKSHDGDKGHRQDYEDTPTTHAMRNVLTDINQWLTLAPLSLTDSTQRAANFELEDRTLRRVFTRGSFESGGRLFGGFWQSMSKVDRLTGIRIAGEPVVGLDYGQMGPRIVYGLSEVLPDQDDLYSIKGMHSDYRSGIKKLMNAMLFAEKAMKRKPDGLGDILPPYNIRTLCDLICKSHPKISHQFFTGIGHTTQFIESEVMMKVLGEMKRVGIVCLPIHDGVLVPRSTQRLAVDIMCTVARDVVGLPVPVSVETGIAH